MALHASLVLMRAHGGLFLGRVFFEFVAGSALMLPLAWAKEAIEAAPGDPGAWTAALAFALAGSGLYLIVTTCVRAGVFRAATALVAERRRVGLFWQGAAVFPQALFSLYVLVWLDVLAFGSAGLCLLLALPLGVAHGLAGAAFGAAATALVLAAALAANAFGRMALALAMMDECDVVEGWARLRGVLGLQGADASWRFVWFAAMASGLAGLAVVVEGASGVSSVLATWRGDDLGASMWLWLVPLLVAFLHTMLDVAAVVFMAALTDRLPVGFAARMVPARHGAAKASDGV